MLIIFKKIINKIQYLATNYIDIYLSIIGVFLGISIVCLYIFVSKTIHLLMLGFALSLASLIYLLIKNRKETSETFVSKSIQKIYEIVFFVLFTVSLLILHTNTDRPFSYFFMIALSSGILALSIISVNTKINIALQIFKIILISLNLKYSLFLSYWGSGVDYWGHLLDNLNLANNGYIEILSGKEVFFPLMHIQVAVNQIITGSQIKEATNFGIIIPLIISSVCILLVAKKFLDVRIGLLAMLLVNISDFHILWGSAPQTTTFGIILYFFLIFTIIIASITSTHRMLWSALVFTFIVSIVLSHAVSSFIIFITILGLFIGSIFYKIFFDNSISYFPSVIFFFLYSILLINHWDISLYHGLDGGTSFFEKILSGFQFFFTKHADLLNRPETIKEYAAVLPPFLERAANTMGLSIFIGLSVIGSLFWLSNNNRDKIKFTMVVATLSLLFITFIFPFMGIRNIMPSRWFAFIYFFLSLIAAFAIINLLMKISNQNLKKVVCFGLIFSLTFFMTASTISNLDSPLWLKESSISTTYTIQEGAGAETIVRISEKVMLDSRYSSAVGRISHQTEYIIFQSEEQIEKITKTVFIWRDYMLDRPIKMSALLEGYYKEIVVGKVLKKKYLETLNRFNKIYENDDMCGFYLE